MLLVVGYLNIRGSLTILHNHEGRTLFKNRIDPNGYYYDWY
jgi:hypothetical protein